MLKHNFFLFVIFIGFGLLLCLMNNWLGQAHENGLIYYFSSDAAEYYRLYYDIYEDFSFSDSLSLFFVGSPVLLLKFFNGNLFAVQFFNLFFMFYTLSAIIRCLPTSRSRTIFLLGSLLFPYFSFGFLSLNKEVYAMCSAILYVCYLLRGSWQYLGLALLCALLARYYMFLTFLVVFLIVPYRRSPKILVYFFVIIVVSLFAPVAKYLVPEYSAGDQVLLDGSGASAHFFAVAIDNFCYFIVYPFKYAFLLPQRIYSFAIDPLRLSNGMEAFVSILTIIAILFCVSILVRRRVGGVAWQLLFIAFFTPAMMMWSEIMHWRYYSFVYFFFLSFLALWYSGASQFKSGDEISHE